MKPPVLPLSAGRDANAQPSTVLVALPAQNARDLALELERIVRVQQEIAAARMDLQALMQMIAERAQELAGADGAVIELVDGADLVCRAASGKAAQQVGTRLQTHDSLSGFTIRARSVVVSHDTEVDPRVNLAVARFVHARSIIVAPLGYGDDIIGVLKVMYAQPHAFGQREIQSVQILVVSLGAVIQRHRDAEQLLRSESQYRLLFENNPQPMLIHDLPDLRIVAINQAAIDHYGYSEEAFLRMRLQDLAPPADAGAMAQAMQEQQGRQRAIWRHLKRDGATIDMEIVSHAMDFNGRPARLLSGNDVTESLRAERELARISRAQQMLIACNEALVRAADEVSLLTEICRITVEIGGYRMAWVGLAMQDAECTVVPAAHFGSDMTYLRSLRMSWSDKEIIGRGPSGRTIRCGQMTLVDDVQADPSYQPWLSRALAMGYRGVRSLPLNDSERTFGVLNLYVVEAEPASTDEVKLLAATAENLAFGISNLRAQQERRELQARIRDQASLLDKAQDAIIVRTIDDRIVFWNQGAERLYGWSSTEAVGVALTDLVSNDLTASADATARILGTGEWTGELSQCRKDGSVFSIEGRWTLIRDDAGVPQSIFEINTDITRRKAAEREIQKLAFFDPLTRLPNRLLLQNRLQHALAASARSLRHGALLFIDLDNFKTLNDTLGHDQGDLLLQEVAQRLSACVREADTLARLGGDEFVVILESMSDHLPEAITQATQIGEKILAALSKPYLFAGYQHHSTASIGVTLFSDQSELVSELLKRADLAMYQAKAAGRNTLRFFDPQMQKLATDRVLLEVDLRNGLQQQEFILHYQPQYNRQGIVTGVEALLRWQHPRRGLVSPLEFIPFAEETGLIVPLGLWVLETACLQLADWSRHPARASLKVAVNVSARQFRHPQFVAQFLEVIARTGVDPTSIKLELTESLLLDNVEESIAKMTVLQKRGVGFALDDFGTGYSSLSYLKRLPLAWLKIDQSFVRDVLTNANDSTIARTIVALAHSLGLRVMAEGVETEEQRAFLDTYLCDGYQGYLFSRPLAIAALELFLQAAEEKQLR